MTNEMNRLGCVCHNPKNIHITYYTLDHIALRITCISVALVIIVT